MRIEDALAILTDKQQGFGHEPGVARQIVIKLNAFIAEKKGPGHSLQDEGYPVDWLPGLMQQANLATELRTDEVIREDFTHSLPKITGWQMTGVRPLLSDQLQPIAPGLSALLVSAVQEKTFSSGLPRPTSVEDEIGSMGKLLQMAIEQDGFGWKDRKIEPETQEQLDLFFDRGILWGAFDKIGCASIRSMKSIVQLIAAEKKRQQETLMMIPSENYTYPEVRKAVGSVFMHKYSEGYAHKRYYQGNAVVDDVEDAAVLAAKHLFGVPHANVQPYSGSPANAAVLFALLAPGDTIMGLRLSGGGHLTHGHPNITFSGKFFHSVQYDVEPDGFISYDKLEALARQEKPKLIIAGTTAYPRTLDWKRFAKIADSIGAFLMADIAHIAGLVAVGSHPSPVPYVDVVTTTTHKTLRGPRGAIILVTEKGLKKDPDMEKKIDRAVFPGLQGGPHNNTTAGIAIALQFAAKKAFIQYGNAIVSNASVLAEALLQHGFELATGGTDNHLMVVDVRPFGIDGKSFAILLEQAGIIVNANTIPHDPNPPYRPSGIRLGTPALTTRKMGSKEMKKIAAWIAEAAKSGKNDQLVLKNIRGEVKALCKKFPIDLS